MGLHTDVTCSTSLHGESISHRSGWGWAAKHTMSPTDLSHFFRAKEVIVQSSTVWDVISVLLPDWFHHADQNQTEIICLLDY